LSWSEPHARQRRPTASQAELERIYAEAQAEDLQADYQVSIVLLFADDALQRFAKGVSGKAPGLNASYGPEYGTHRGKVKLTALLRAGTNAIRHVSEWDDYPWTTQMGAVYPRIEHCQSEFERMAMRNIIIFQNVFGLGITERIRDVVSMRMLIQVDGNFLGGQPTDYAHFESAMMEAAREIAAERGGNGA
jgi:hypothetical protein